MSETHPTTARSSLRWALLILVVIAIAALLWWLWPAPNKEAPQRPGGRPGFGAFGGAVPVRVAKVEQGEFEVFNKALGSVTPLNTVNLRSRVAGELVELRFEEGQRVKKGDLLAVIDPRPYKVALQQAEGTLQQNRAQLKNAQVDFERYRGLYADDSIAKQTLDTQEALVSQYQGTLAANQAAVNEARLNLEFTQIRAPIDGRVGLRQLDVGNLVAANDTTPLVVITQTQPMSISFTLPEGDLLPVLTRYRQGDKLVVQIWDRGEKVMFGEGVLESIDNQQVYRVFFQNQSQIYEVYARNIYQSELYGFVEIEDYTFGNKSKVVIDPSEEKLRNEFEGVQRSFIPMHAIVRIDEVEKEGVAKITSSDGSTVTPFPMPVPTDR